MTLHNLARVTSATTGTGTLTLGSAVSGFLTFADAGVTNSEVVTYAIRDGSNSEIGRGTYTSAGTTLSRDTVYESTNAGAKIDCSGSQEVFITAAAEDIYPLAFGIVKRTSGDYTVGAGGSFADVDTSNVTITFTTGARRVRLVLQASGGNGTSGGSTMLDFTVDGTRVGSNQGLLIHTTPTASNNQNLSMEYITDVLSAASHTFRVQWKADTGTGTLRANTTTTPLVFWAEELNLTS